MDALRPEEKEVIGQAERLDGLLGTGTDWARHHLAPAQVRSFLEKSLNGKRATVRKIHASARRPIALGVFGASQCGKSFLISELVKGDDKRPLEVFTNPAGGKPVPRDYLDHINPPGGRESTALVTRFTKRPYATVKGCSLLARLLGRTDLIKIFMNGFLFECQSEFLPSADELSKLRASIRGRAPEVTPVFTEADAWDIQDYVKRHFRNQFAKALEDINYWGVFNDEIRFLPFETQIPYLEWLWGRFPRLTELYRSLHLALGELGTQVVGLFEEALIPRDKSIIDVQRLAGLSRPGNRKIVIALADGGRLEMDTSTVCALTRELILCVPEDLGPSLLDQMDVLDFPGARSREQAFDNLKLNDPLALSEVFLRGKVAYLFDCTSDERDITGLVLCQEGGNQEAKSLPYMINKWVEWSHGTTPEERAGKPVTLFHVFTKFDQDLVKKKGESHEVRWSSRLRTNFEEFFGRAGDWATQWDPHTPFRNCFWVRNPNVQQTIFGRDAQGREIPIDQAYLDEARGRYLAHPLVKAHFQSPEEAWDQAATPDHCGIGWLKEAIRRAIDPRTKVRQLAANLEAILAEVKAQLRPYYVGDDIAEARAAAEERARQRLATLVKVMPTHYSLAMLLDRERFALSEKAVAAIYDAILNPMLEEGGPPGTSPEAAPAAGPQLFDADAFAIDGITPTPEPATDTGGSTGPSGGRRPPTRKGELFAQSVLRKWEEQLVRLTTDLEFQREIGLDTEWLGDVAQELMKGAFRKRLYEKIAEESDRHLNATNAPRLMRIQAVATTSLLNQFVMELGEPREDRPIPDGPPKATLSPKAYPGLHLYKHWTTALLRLYRNNIAEDEVADEASNALLKQILDATLTPRTAAAEA